MRVVCVCVCARSHPPPSGRELFLFYMFLFLQTGVHPCVYVCVCVCARTLPHLLDVNCCSSFTVNCSPFACVCVCDLLIFYFIFYRRRPRRVVSQRAPRAAAPPVGLTSTVYIFVCVCVHALTPHPPGVNCSSFTEGGGTHRRRATFDRC